MKNKLQITQYIYFKNRAYSLGFNLLLTQAIVFITSLCFSQSTNIISSVGPVEFQDYKTDQENQTYLITGGQLFDSLFINGIYLPFITNKENNEGKIDYINLSKHDLKNQILQYSQFIGDFEYGSFEIDPDQNLYITFFSFSDTLSFNDSIFTNTNFKYNLILFKLNANFKLITYKIFQNAGTAYNKIKIANDRIILSSAYHDTLKVNEREIFALNTSNPHSVSNFLSVFDLNLDSLHFLINFSSKGITSISDFTMDSNDNLTLCGKSVGITFKINDSIISHNTGYNSLFVIQFNNKLKINWVFKIPDDGSSEYRSICKNNNNQFLISGNYFSDNLVIENDTLINNFSGYPSCFVICLNNFGKLVKAYSLITNKRCFSLHLIQSSKEMYYSVVSSHDTLEDVNGNQYYSGDKSGYYIIKFDSIFNILDVYHFSNSSGYGITKISLDNSDNLFASLFYFGFDTLFYKNKIIDINKSRFSKFLIINFDKLTITRNEVKFTALELFPNPSNGTLCLDHIYGDDINLVIWNQNGKIVISKNLSTDHDFCIDLPNLLSGSYFVSLFNKGKLLGSRVWLKYD